MCQRILLCQKRQFQTMSRTQNQSHATRFYDGQALQERHPDLSEPFHGDVVKDEIAIAFGRRHVHKLVELVSLPKEDLTPEKRATALRYLLGVLTNQESKAEAIGTNVAAPLVVHITDDSDDVRRIACEVMASLATSRDGRTSLIAADAVTATAMKMLKDRNPEVRGAACSFLAAFSSAHDGARHVLEAADGSVFEKIVKLLDDDATPTSAKTSACETLGGCTLTDEGVHAGLEARLPKALLRVLDREEARMSSELRTQVAHVLKNLCQVEIGRTQCLVAGAVKAMAPLLRNTDADVRLQASGCLQAIALERDAKMPVCEAARVNLVMLLRDPVVGVVQNAVAAIRASSDLPDARRKFFPMLAPKDKDYVFPNHHTWSRDLRGPLF